MVNNAALKEEYEIGRLFTYAEYKDWELAQGERYELVHGEACLMAAPVSIFPGLVIDLSRVFSI